MHVPVVVVKHLFGSLVFRQCVNYRTAIAHAVGKQEEAYGHGSHGYEYLEEERQQVFFLFQYDQPQILTSGAHFFGQWWADSIGTVNVAQEIDKDNSVPVNLEQVYAWNPDVIFITNFTTAQPEDLYQNTVGTYDWSGIDAVKNQRVYKMPLGMYRSYTPGVDTPITLLWLAKTVYPERFEDIDLTEQVVAYYEDVFGVTLTAEQAEQIFTPTAQAGEGF